MAFLEYDVITNTHTHIPLGIHACTLLSRLFLFVWVDCLVGLVVKVSASRAAGLGSIPAFAVGLFQGRVTPIIGTPRLGLFGLVSVHCDWVRQTV